MTEFDRTDFVSPPSHLEDTTPDNQAGERNHDLTHAPFHEQPDGEQPIGGQEETLHSLADKLRAQAPLSAIQRRQPVAASQRDVSGDVPRDTPHDVHSFDFQGFDSQGYDAPEHDTSEYDAPDYDVEDEDWQRMPPWMRQDYGHDLANSPIRSPYQEPPQPEAMQRAHAPSQQHLAAARVDQDYADLRPGTPEWDAMAFRSEGAVDGYPLTANPLTARYHPKSEAARQPTPNPQPAPQPHSQPQAPKAQATATGEAPVQRPLSHAPLSHAQSYAHARMGLDHPLDHGLQHDLAPDLSEKIAKRMEERMQAVQSRKEKSSRWQKLREALPRPRDIGRPVLLAGAGALSLLVIATGFFLVSQPVPKDPPYIAALSGPEKIVPEDHGGMYIPNQDVGILNGRAGLSQENVQLRPLPEIPMDQNSFRQSTQRASSPQPHSIDSLIASFAAIEPSGQPLTGAAQAGRISAAPAEDSNDTLGALIEEVSNDPILMLMQQEGMIDAQQPSADGITAPDLSAVEGSLGVAPGSLTNGSAVMDIQGIPEYHMPSLQELEGKLAQLYGSSSGTVTPAPIQSAPAGVSSSDIGVPDAPWAPPLLPDDAVKPIGLQLAAYRSANGARAAWRKISAQHKDLLGDMVLRVQRISLAGKGTFYRLQVGPFPNELTALDLCEQLMQRGHRSCYSIKG